jgi:hypothetical protein
MIEGSDEVVLWRVVAWPAEHIHLPPTEDTEAVSQDQSQKQLREFFPIIVPKEPREGIIPPTAVPHIHESPSIVALEVGLMGGLLWGEVDQQPGCDCHWVTHYEGQGCR